MATQWQVVKKMENACQKSFRTSNKEKGYMHFQAEILSFPTHILRLLQLYQFSFNSKKRKGVWFLGSRAESHNSKSYDRIFEIRNPVRSGGRQLTQASLGPFRPTVFCQIGFKWKCRTFTKKNIFLKKFKRGVKIKLSQK